MNSRNYWDLFLETGAPEYYLLYNQTRRMEDKHVFNDSGIGSQDCGLQG